MDIFVVAQQMLILFAMMAIGFFLYKIKWINDENYSFLSRLVVTIFNPLLMIHGIFGKSLAETGHVFWENLLMVFLCYTILFVAGFLLVTLLRPAKDERAVYRLMVLLPNCGFMGIPLVSSLLGQDYLIYVTIYMLTYNIIIYTYGIYLIRKSARESSGQEISRPTLWETFRPVLLNSGVITSVIALILFFGDVPVHDSIRTLCGYLGNPCIPLSMILIGASLAANDLPKLIKNVRMYGFILWKMLLVPISCCFLIRILPFDDMICKLFIIMLSLPAGSLVVLVTEQNRGNKACASCGVALSTLASILTIPVVALFL